VTTVTLSRVHPDYAQVKAQLQLALQNKDTWQDLLDTATGDAIISFIAGVGDYDQFSIEQGFKEGFFDTARKDSSIYAGSRHLGVRLSRKLPASLTVTLTRPTPWTATYAIPALEAFNIQGAQLFNRDPIVFGVGVGSVPVQLHEGYVISSARLSDGSDFQMFLSPETSFNVSDEDVIVSVGSLTVEVLKQGLWHAKNLEGVQDTTWPDGRLLLTFGNDIYGTKPATNDTVTIQYAITQGVNGNNAALAGKTITYSADPDVQGPATTGLANGSDEKPTIFYKKFSPLLFAADGGATKEEEWRAVAVQYPGVYDAEVIGQHKLSPSDLRYMNLTRVSLLTDTPMSALQWDEFSEWYKQRIMFPVRFYREDPVPAIVNIEADIYCTNQADLTEVQLLAIDAVQELFVPRPGILGANLYISDIITAIKNSHSTIDYVNLRLPTTNIYTHFDPAPQMDISIPITGVGLAPGHYSYSLVYITPIGETLASNFKSTDVTVGMVSGTIQLDWELIPGVLGYKIYGRTYPGSIGLLATLGPTVDTWQDDGTAVTGTAPPTVESIGVHYVELGTLALNMDYADRLLT
jgi:hypothetical protein